MSVSDTTLKKLQAIELSMLKECVRICEQEHIRYFLIGGSAIGAVRHAGFIPWDDDIDIGMPRPDYEKFMSVAQKELPADFFLQNHKTDSSYPYVYAKIRKANTSFIETRLSHLNINHGVYIDVFPLDGSPKSELIQAICWREFNVFRTAIWYKAGIVMKPEVRKSVFLFFKIFFSFKWLREKTGIMGIPQNLTSLFFAKFFSLGWLHDKAEQVMRKYDYAKSNRVVNWGGRYGVREIVPNNFFGKGCRMKFEGVEIMIPTNYDGYLRSIYGDYMKLPPTEERKSLHSTLIVDLGNDKL